MIGRLVQDPVVVKFCRVTLIPSVELIIDRLLVGTRHPNSPKISLWFFKGFPPSLYRPFFLYSGEASPKTLNDSGHLSELYQGDGRDGVPPPPGSSGETGANPCQNFPNERIMRKMQQTPRKGACVDDNRSEYDTGIGT